MKFSHLLEKVSIKISCPDCPNRKSILVVSDSINLLMLPELFSRICSSFSPILKLNLLFISYSSKILTTLLSRHLSFFWIQTALMSISILVNEWNTKIFEGKQSSIVKQDWKSLQTLVKDSQCTLSYTFEKLY